MLSSMKKTTLLILLVVAVISLRIFAVRARAESAVQEGEGSANRVVDEELAKKCVPRSVCFKDSDCDAADGDGGKKAGGSCVGTFVGKCNCDACVPGTPCSDDSACGGLKHACDSQTGLCDCIEGFQANGYSTYGGALLELCNAKACGGDVTSAQDNCSGLPCRAGRCLCPQE